MTEKIKVHEKPRGEAVYAYIHEFKGVKYLDIREWYMDKDNEEKPTKKGVMLPLDKVEELRTALEQLLGPGKAEAVK